MAKFSAPCQGESKLESMVHLASSYQKRIRPFLDTVDRLRRLNLMKEGIQLPTIVVVGDQSSGKSSVLESLTGISLPRGQGICTRVPLIIRLQNHQQEDSELTLEYRGKFVFSSEEDIAADIIVATKEVAGDGKTISNTSLTLVVRKRGLPDLTMIDLPGITRVPIHGQPDDIYEQIAGLIMEYISSKESIILNVLSATVDFSTCESIRMLQRVDKTGERTLAVVTKVDKSPEGLLEKVTSDDVNIGLGYVCVRNRVGDEESYVEARRTEAELFRSHPLLSKIDKSIVGVPQLTQRLTQIQSFILAKCLPDIVSKVNEKLNQNTAELNELPKSLSTVSDAMAAFIKIVGASKESLRKIILRVDLFVSFLCMFSVLWSLRGATGEYEEFPDEEDMHCKGLLDEMLDDYANDLRTKYPHAWPLQPPLLEEEMRVLGESQGFWLPNFRSRMAFLALLRENVSRVSNSPTQFINKVWSYLETVVLRVFMMHSESYPQLQISVNWAAQNVLNKMRTWSVERVREMVETEKIADYTCSPEYRRAWSRFISKRNKFMARVMLSQRNKYKPLREKNALLVEQAFDLKVRMVAYWKIVVTRLVDNVALHLIFALQKLVTEELDAGIIDDLVGPHIERMLEESPAIVNKRTQLNRSIQLLREAKDTLSSMVDRIAAPAREED
ncbi:Dynamin-related protein 4C [Nymphaea thermarum]|nr:Dynamin-related protein 4C [Nymphaea thermarum]